MIGTSVAVSNKVFFGSLDFKISHEKYTQAKAFGIQNFTFNFLILLASPTHKKKYINKDINDAN